MEGVQAFARADAAASLIGWWREAGVDTLVSETPHDWLAAKTPAPPMARPSPQALPPTTPVADRAQGQPLPATLAELIAWMRDSPDVPEAGWGRTRIMPAGDAQADVMILTDQPETKDTEAGMLMAGELGALFDKMLVAIGLDRSKIWLASMATIRPAGGRVSPDAANRLTEIARHHIALVAPKRLLIMGDTPNRALIGPDWQGGRGSLQTINLGKSNVESVATFHPRLLLERPAYKAQAWKDLQLLMKGLG